MNVEKIIRVLGYIIYMALWMPFTLLFIVGAPIMVLTVELREGGTFKNAMKWYTTALKNMLRHDINFIKTGEW